MTEIFLSDSAKAQVLNATLHAEQEYIKSVRRNARREAAKKIKIKHIERELTDREIYSALYRLCCNLGLGELYDDWREAPTYEEEDDT